MSWFCLQVAGRFEVEGYLVFVDLVPEPLREEDVLVPQRPLLRVLGVEIQVPLLDVEVVSPRLPGCSLVKLPLVEGITDAGHRGLHGLVFVAAVGVDTEHFHEIPVEVDHDLP